MGPDYLCDPRLSRVPLPLLKKFIGSSGDIPSKAEEALKEAQTKFAVISLVEQYSINLDDFLGAVVGPIDSVPAEEAISAPDKATGLVVGTAAEDEELERVGKTHAGEISALLEGDKKRKEEQAKRDAELAKEKETKEEKARKVEEDFRAGLRAEREAKEQAARDKIAAEVHLIEMMDKVRGLSGQEILRQVEEVGHEASTIAIYLGIDVDALKDCIDALKKINPNADELKPYEEIEKRARREHARMAALEKVQKLVDATDPFKIGVSAHTCDARHAHTCTCTCFRVHGSRPGGSEQASRGRAKPRQASPRFATPPTRAGHGGAQGAYLLTYLLTYLLRSWRCARRLQRRSRRRFHLQRWRTVRRRCTGRRPRRYGLGVG